ncbi:PepSY domain-containing protein [Nocardia sp. NBC_01730]|uniref:PepSY domain-containing protein n=1 Tax=Nocardia sp. NBC_01730 TaxID=2975998 RepID=UPI002E0FAABF|nr:PepSY domain-containing protein [Nocardia sp. NBC_01730]
MAAVFHRAFAGLRWILVGAAAVAVVAGVSHAVATVATGGNGGNGGNTVAFSTPATGWSLIADPGITRQQAIDKAVEAVPGGRAGSAEFDTDGGSAVWEVELVTPDGVEHEVTVDANSGKVLATVNHD